jgi:hypothetical protein
MQNATPPPQVYPIRPSSTAQPIQLSIPIRAILPIQTEPAKLWSAEAFWNKKLAELEDQ